MRRSPLTRLALIALSGAALAAPYNAALAQPLGAEEPTEPGQLADAQLVRDFVYFVQIDAYEVAADYGAEILRRGYEGERFVAIVSETREQERFENAIARARRVIQDPGLRRIAEEIDQLYETGRRQQARRPSEIARNIELLTGPQRGRILARDRLVFAGEYAVPQLFEAYMQSEDPILRAQSRTVLRELGRQAVVPLSVALSELSPDRQVLLVGLLREVRHEAWLPFVFELHESTNSDRVRQACAGAIRELLGGRLPTGDVATAFYELAERYFDEARVVTSFPDEDFQLYWTFGAGGRLIPEAVRTEVYHELMAMRLAARSLRHRTDNNEALPLWVASNLRRELETPDGYETSLYPSDRPEAIYYAVALGNENAQWVLGRAMDRRDTRLARRAIEAIEATAGSRAMRSPVTMAGSQDRRPLLEALSYPNRRVQYEAAVALAASQPDVNFDGAERVVPILASAVLDASRRIAVVVSFDDERAGALRRFMEGQGYEVVAGRDIAGLSDRLATLPGVDVVLLEYPAAELMATVERIRADRALGAAPIMVTGRGEAFAALRQRLDRDPTISARSSGITEQQLTESLNDLLDSASGGPITTREAETYANAALEQLRDLAVSGNPVLDVADAAVPLMTALNRTSGRTRFAVAEVLSRVNQSRVQAALMEAALGGSGIERFELLNYTAASARRFGNMLNPAQVDVLVSLVRSADGLEGQAAAALMGSLGLPGDVVLPLITGADTETARR